MNYWQLNKKQTKTFKQKIQSLIFQHIEVQQSRRTKLQSLLIILNYGLSYIVLFFIILQSLGKQFLIFNNDENSLTNNSLTLTLTLSSLPSLSRLQQKQIQSNYYKIIMILMFVRLAFGIVYIFVQKIIIIVVIKSLLIVNLFLTEYESINEDFIGIEIPLLLIQIVAILVWSFKIQSRIKHYDSRLKHLQAFCKEAIVFCIAFLIRRVQKMDFSTISLSQLQTLSPFEWQSCLIISISLIFIILFDFGDIIYHKQFKSTLLGLDLSVISLLFSWIFSRLVYHQNMLFYNYLTFFLVITCLILFLVFRKQQFNLLYQKPIKSIQFQPEEYLINYYQTLRKLIHLQDQKQTYKNLHIIKFIQFHRQECLFPNCPFTKIYNITLSLQSKVQLLNEFMIKSLQQMSKNKPLLRKYLISYLSPQDKVFKYVNSSSDLLYMKRQVHRINSIKKQMSAQVKIFQSQLMKKQIQQIFQQYMNSGKYFYQSLLKQKINSQNLICLATRMLKSITKIQTIKNKKQNMTQQTILLLNNFTSRLIQQHKSQILQSVVDPPFLLNKISDNGPILLVSAQPQDFLSIFDCNISCTKQLYYKREDIIKLTVTDLLPDQIKQKHFEHFQKASKRISFKGQKDFPQALFMMNKDGFVVFFTAVVYLINSIKGRIWCVATQIVYKIQSIVLVFQSNNILKVKGITQMALFHGFNKSDKDRVLKEQFASKIRQKQVGSKKFKTIYIQSYEQIFEQCSFFFYQPKTLHIIQQVNAFGLHYYLIDIKSSESPQSITKVRSSLLKSQISFASKNQFIQLATQQQQNFILPKDKQMFYHSDGVVRFYAQTDQHIIEYFQRLKSSQFNTDESLYQKPLQEITQMRLLNDGNLDFIENIQQETQFSAKPKTQLQIRSKQLQNFNIKKQFCDQSIQTNNKLTPKWLNLTRVVFVVTGIICIVSLCVFLVYNTNRVSAMQSNQSILQGISENTIRYIELSRTLISYKYFTSLSKPQSQTIKQSITFITKQIQQRSKQINSIDSSIQVFLTENKIVQQSIQKYLIGFNNISAGTQQNNSYLTTYNQSMLFDQLVQNIVPSFNSLLLSKLSSFQQSNSNYNIMNMLLIIMFNFIQLLLITWISIILYLITKSQQQIIHILTRINDKSLKKQYIKIQLFYQYLHFDKQIFIDDDVQYLIKLENNQIINLQEKHQEKHQDMLKTSNRKIRRFSKIVSSKRQQSQQKLNTNHQLLTQPDNQVLLHDNHSQQQEQNAYVKQLSRKGFLSIGKLLKCIWIIWHFSISFAFYQQIHKYGQFSIKMFQIQNKSNQVQISSDLIWILLNRFPYDYNRLRIYQRQMYQSQSQFKQKTVQLINKNYLSQNYKQVFINLWTQNCCMYLQQQLSDCNTILNGALEQGADQIISYLNRKYNLLITLGLTQQQFRQSQTTKKVQHIQSNYIFKAISLNSDAFSDQHTKIGQAFKKNMFIYFMLILLSFIGGLCLVYKYLTIKKQHINNMQRIFTLIEFENLSRVKQFKLYFKKKYYDRIFK